MYICHFDLHKLMIAHPSYDYDFSFLSQAVSIYSAYLLYLTLYMLRGLCGYLWLKYNT